MINAPEIALQFLERHVVQSLVESVPPEVLRDELQGVRDRIGELIEEVESHAQRLEAASK